jgi:serine protease Do
MTRATTLALGVAAILLAGLALGPGDVRAGGKADDERKVERSVRIVGLGDGAFLGVGLDDLEGDARGAKVRSVEEGSPADKAGIQEGDVIVGFDGEAVRSASQLARLVRETPPGRSVTVEVTRGGTKQKLTARLGEGHGGFRMALPGLRDFDIEVPEPPEPPRPPLPPSPHAWGYRSDDGHGLVFRMFDRSPRKLGIEYMEMGEQLAAYFKLSENKGILVTSVDADGPAARAGMKAGDVILKFDGESIRDAEDLREAVSDAEGGQAVTVAVQRDGRSLDLEVTLAKPESRRIRRSCVTL